MEPGEESLAFEVVPEARLVVLCHTGVIPTDREWDDWLTVMANEVLRADGCRFLVMSERGHPTNAQIERLRLTAKRVKASGRSEPPIAIISPSSAMRIFVNVLMVINPRIRCYAPADHERAFDHIKLTRGERATALAVVERLYRRLNIKGALNV